MIKIILIFTFSAITFISFSQIQVLTGIENRTYFKIANEMNNYLPKLLVEEDSLKIEKDFLDIKATQGSNLNFDLIINEKHPAKAAIVQLDLLLLKKTDDLINNTNFTEDILVLMPLILVDVHLVTKKGSSIHNIKSLEDKTVGIGEATEGTYSTAMYIQNTSEVAWINKNISSQDALKALLLDRIDAFFMVAGAPVQMLAAIPVNSPLKLKFAEVENINGWADYYTPLTLTSTDYPFLEANVRTFSVPSVVIVNKKKLSEKDIVLLKEWRANTIQNIDNLKGYGHQSWQTANPSLWDSDIWPVLE